MTQSASQPRASRMVPRARRRTVRGVRERLAPLWEERTVDDPREIAGWYTLHRGWGDMPGQGVCSIDLRKPA